MLKINPKTELEIQRRFRQIQSTLLNKVDKAVVESFQELGMQIIKISRDKKNYNDVTYALLNSYSATVFMGEKGQAKKVVRHISPFKDKMPSKIKNYSSSKGTLSKDQHVNFMKANARIKANGAKAKFVLTVYPAVFYGEFLEGMQTKEGKVLRVISDEVNNYDLKSKIAQKIYEKIHGETNSIYMGGGGE